MQILSVFLGKFVLILLKLTGRTGSALPGLVVEKTNKKFLKRALDQLPESFIVVTGTNGKTTTTKIISDLLRANGLRVLTNDTGSNFVRGVISAIVKNSTWSGKLPYDIAVLEQDEAHAVHLARRARPRGVVALNVMRDQLDRFGEIDTTSKMIGKLVHSASDFVVLNANDSRIAQLAGDAKAKRTLWFGHDPSLAADFASDDQHHSNGKAGFYQAKSPDVSLFSQDSGNVVLTIDKTKYKTQLQLDGSHNAINAIAALATVREILPKITAENLIQSLEKIQPAFGRGEVIDLKSGAKLRVQLVKNPSGFTQSLKLLDEAAYDHVGIMINDDHADGRDVSWLWDVDFTCLGRAQSISCGGTRAPDMALRLKYDEASSQQSQTSLNKYVRSINKQLNQGSTGIVFCTYTAMLQLRGELSKYSDDISGAIL